MVSGRYFTLGIRSLLFCYYERFAQVALNKRATVSDSLEKIREHCMFLAVFPPFYVKEQIALVELRSFDLLEIATVRESLRSL